MAPIIEVTGLTKRYGTLAVVDDIGFAVEEGEIFSLLGPTGAGKTTTISMLSGLLSPTHGDATIAGYSIVAAPMAVKTVIGVVPQKIALDETLNARENLLFRGRLYGLSGSTLSHRVDEVLTRVGLARRAKDKVNTYSGGMKRRLNIGVGLLHRPRVLLMDEPAAGVDPQSHRNILDSVKGLNRDGITVLYTTHDIEEAQELSHRLGIIDRGRLIAQGSAAELRQLLGECETVRL